MGKLMTIHPARMARIRQHQEHAVRLSLHGMRPSNTEVAELVADLTDMVNDYTNEHRGN